jgi:hypothetical protein
LINSESTINGDTIIIPNGTCTWGASGSYINLNKAITLKGASRDSVIINISPTAGTYTNAIIRFNSAATVKDITIQTPITGEGSSGTAFSASADGFRITNIRYIGRTASINGYFVYSGVYGLIDNCHITGGHGSDELIVSRGPTDSWQTVDSIGGASNLFIENNTFDGQGYVCDINSNGRAVLRFNSINGNMKIDGHGKCTNTPNRSVRHMEIYNNKWTVNDSNQVAIELRGGTARIFGNEAVNSLTNSYIFLRDYASFQTICFGYTPDCGCPDDYPLDDQIGVGIDPKVAASDPVYAWGNIKNGVHWSIASPNTGISFASCAIENKCGTSYNSITQIQAGRDYFDSVTKPPAMIDYQPYSCPHPMVGSSGYCDYAVAGTTGYKLLKNQGSPKSMMSRPPN